ncbi:DUF4391 domain-containing protein [Amycolatopsis sp. cmx-11-51]|uniref:DUF4391 domain-containing protein n=1 Tax=Amycolatopsis sp. cmx-11-51 TaxID=2785797 RepID=UPI0039E38EC1
MTAPLYRWPVGAKFGRVVPKNKFYEHAQVTAGVKKKFVDQVLRITWAYKLAEATINLAGTDEVPELQVFQVDAKNDDVADVVLAAIDRAVKTPVIFELTRSTADFRQTRMVAAHKDLTAGVLRGGYFTTPWQGFDTEREPLPAAINLSTLYAALVGTLLPVAARPGEGLSEVTARIEAVRQLEREIGALDRRIRNEPQFNRKVELRRALRIKQGSLAELMSQTPGTMN